MEENEYKDNEKVLFKTRVTLQGWKSEEADCFITEGHVVIESRKPIKIALSRIKDFDIHDFSGTAKLTFVDDNNKKRTLHFDTGMSLSGPHSRNLLSLQQVIHREMLKLTTDKQAVETFIDNIQERPKDTAWGGRDRLCASLQSIGIDTQMAERGQFEENISGEGSVGIIRILEGPIRWVNVRFVPRGSGSPTPDYYCFVEYGVPDPKLGPNSPIERIETVRVKSRPIFGKVVDLRWEGRGSYPGVISRLNSDYQIKDVIMQSLDVAIRAKNIGCWLIIIETPNYDFVQNKETWDCYQAIANHLLADWTST